MTASVFVLYFIMNFDVSIFWQVNQKVETFQLKCRVRNSIKSIVSLEWHSGKRLVVPGTEAPTPAAYDSHDPDLASDAFSVLLLLHQISRSTFYFCLEGFIRRVRNFYVHWYFCALIPCILL